MRTVPVSSSPVFSNFSAIIPTDDVTLQIKSRDFTVGEQTAWLFMDQASSLVLPWESSLRDGGRRRGFILLVHADYRY